MKKLVLAAAVIGAIVFAARRVATANFRKNSEQRVRIMLEQLQLGGSGPEGVALCQWAVALNGCSEDIQRLQTGAFDAWRLEKDVYTVQSYELRGFRAGSEGGDAVAFISCNINGKDLTIRVQSGKPLTWA